MLAAALDELFDSDLSSWLLAEMAENRDKHIGPSKVCLACLPAQLLSI